MVPPGLDSSCFLRLALVLSAAFTGPCRPFRAGVEVSNPFAALGGSGFGGDGDEAVQAQDEEAEGICFGGKAGVGDGVGVAAAVQGERTQLGQRKADVSFDPRVRTCASVYRLGNRYEALSSADAGDGSEVECESAASEEDLLRGFDCCCGPPSSAYGGAGMGFRREGSKT